MFKVAIVDDSLSDVTVLRESIERYGKENNVEFSISEYANAIEFEDAIASPFDVVFLDIRMPGINGFEIAKLLREKNEAVRIVFVTNLVNYAIRGYEVDASDYMLKPLEYSTFAYKLGKILKRVQRVSENSFVVRINGGQQRIHISELLYVESLGHRLIYHTDSADIESWDSLNAAYERLKPSGFEYCNRGFLVNCARVSKVQNNELVLAQKITLQISRNRKKELMAALAKYMC